MRCLQDSAIAPAIISRARYLVTLARVVFAQAASARLIAIIDPKLPALDLIAAAAMDEIITNAYIPHPGRNSLFIGLAPLATDQLFVARLLMRPDIYKAALLEDFAGLDDAEPAPGNSAARLAQAANRLWLKRYDILVPYPPAETHPEEMARDIWQIIGAQMKRAALPLFAIGGAKPRIALLSPLPPARSGIAAYSASLAAELRHRAEITLFAPEQAGDAEMVSHLPYIARRFDRVISVMGNSVPFHGAIYDLLRRYGGACISHDTRLSGFYEQKLGVTRMAALAAAEIGKPVSGDDVTAWLQDETLAGANFLDELAGAARPLILHSYQTAESLNARGFATVRYLPFAICRPWPFGALSLAHRQKARERLGFERNETLIVSPGFIADAKGIEPALQAMVILRERGIAASLIWAGLSRTDIQRWRDRAASLGVAARVKFLDQFLDEESYRDYLLAADCGLQLREGGIGSMSGALQDCIAAGLPAVANASLAAGLNAPYYVTRIADRLDADEIAASLAAQLAERPDTDLARADYTTARSMAAYADGLWKLLELA